MKILLLGAMAASVASTIAAAADIDRPITGFGVSPQLAEPVGESAAETRLRGNIEAYYSRGKTSEGDLDNQTWALRGAVNYDAGNGFNLQGDADYGRSSVEDFDFNRLSGTAHAYYRPATDYAVGLFGQLGRYGTDYFNGLGIGGVDDSLTDKMVGLEAAWFADEASFYIQGGYGKASWTGEDADHLMGRLGARLFLTDNIRFDVEGALHRFSYANTDLDAQTFRTAINYRPDSMPVSVFAGYRYDHWESSVSGLSLGSEANNSVFAGLRYHFGSGSLKDEETSGPVWSTTSLLP